jgi:hypothetical protein
VAELKYLGTTVTIKVTLMKKLKSRINLGNACYHSDYIILSSSLLSKNVKIKIEFPVILCQYFTILFLRPFLVRNVI